MVGFNRAPLLCLSFSRKTDIYTQIEVQNFDLSLGQGKRTSLVIELASINGNHWLKSFNIKLWHMAICLYQTTWHIDVRHMRLNQPGAQIYRYQKHHRRYRLIRQLPKWAFWADSDSLICTAKSLKSAIGTEILINPDYAVLLINFFFCTINNLSSSIGFEPWCRQKNYKQLKR